MDPLTPVECSSPTHLLCARLRNSVGPSQACSPGVRERADVADARAKHAEREPEAYGHVGRGLEVRQQEREPGPS
jgi:hypothetical protein